MNMPVNISMLPFLLPGDFRKIVSSAQTYISVNPLNGIIVHFILGFEVYNYIMPDIH